MSTSIDGDLESTTTAGDDDVSARTGPTADGSAKDGTAAAPRATMRRLRTRRIGVGLVIAALVAAAAATTWKAHQVQQVEDARVGALEAARTRVPALLTYDSSRLDADLGKANEQTTGPFHDDYATVLEEVVSPTAKERGISTRAEVSAAGVVSAQDDRVVVLVFLTQTTTSKGSRSAVSGSRVEVTMQRDGDSWKVAGLDPK